MRTRNNGSRIFMTELMFAIFYFIIIAAICVQAFAKGYLMSREASELTNAVNLAGNACESFYADPDFENFSAFYDENWEETEPDQSVYKVTGIVSSGPSNYSYESTMSLTVTKTEDDSVIYSLNVEKGKGLED